MSLQNTGSSDAVREFNRTRVLDTVRAAPSVSRGELRSATGLARSTVASIVTELLAAELIVETAEIDGERARGRPARRLASAPRRDVVVAVDLGHSHCRVGLVNAQAQVLAEDVSAVDVDGSADAALHHAGSVAERLLASLPAADRLRVVGGAVGLPAPVDVSSGTVGPGNILPQWVDRHPARELEQRLGLPFAIDNDANLGALGESAHGVAAGLCDVVYVKAATGIGAGLVLGGRIHRGTAGRAGEIGHVTVHPDGLLCRCANRGCLETVATVTQVLAAVQPLHDDHLTMEGVARLVTAGEPGALRVVGDAGRAIGRVLADLVNILNPQIVVFGGELAAAGAPLLAGVRTSIERYAQPGLARDLRLEVGMLGARAQLVGAAVLALDGVDGVLTVARRHLSTEARLPMGEAST